MRHRDADTNEKAPSTSERAHFTSEKNHTDCTSETNPFTNKKQTVLIKSNVHKIIKIVKSYLLSKKIVKSYFLNALGNSKNSKSYSFSKKIVKSNAPKIVKIIKSY